MPGAYSEDLRWRIIWYKFLLMRSDEEIAFQLFVCPRTVQRICQKFVLTGNVAAERVGRPVGTTTLHRHEEFIIIEAILKEPATRLHQLASTIQEQTGSEFDVSTVGRTLHRLRLRFTNKKVSIRITDTAYLFLSPTPTIASDCPQIREIAAQRRDDLRVQFKADMLNHSPQTGIVSVAFL